jgi:hypothetical protein
MHVRHDYAMDAPTRTGVLVLTVWAEPAAGIVVRIRGALDVGPPAADPRQETVHTVMGRDAALAAVAAWLDQFPATPRSQ